jgi:hypothetical protein
MPCVGEISEKWSTQPKKKKKIFSHFLGRDVDSAKKIDNALF